MGGMNPWCMHTSFRVAPPLLYCVGMVGTIIVEPDAPSIPPEPDPDPMGEVPTKSGETWIPFFGLELIMVIMLIMVIYNFGRSQGHTETSLEIPDSD